MSEQLTPAAADRAAVNALSDVLATLRDYAADVRDGYLVAPKRTATEEAIKLQAREDVERIDAVLEGAAKYDTGYRPLRIVFDGPPGPEGGRFVEVENAFGRSVCAGEWEQREDGLWQLVIPRKDAVAILTAALENIAEAHVPDQPASSEGDEVAHVQRHVAFLRRAARTALNQASVWAA